MSNSVCVAIDESGYVRKTTELITSCTDYFLSSSQTTLTLDPLIATAAFTGGFGVIVTVGFLNGYIINVILKTIRKV